MLKKTGLFIYIIAILFSVTTKAQDTTAMHDTLVPRKVLIVPFQNKMYMSDANRDMIQESKMELWPMVGKIKSSVNGALKKQFSTKGYVVEILETGNSTAQEDNDLKMIDRSVSLRYLPVPHPVDKAKKEKKDEKKKMEEQTKNPLASYLVGNNKKDEDDHVEKYMATNITGKTLFPYLAEKYHFDYILFINQFEVHTLVDNISISGPEKRELKAHYTLFGKNEQDPLCSSVAKTLIPSDLNNIDEIIKLHFGELTRPISNCLPDASLKHDQIKTSK